MAGLPRRFVTLRRRKPAQLRFAAPDYGAAVELIELGELPPEAMLRRAVKQLRRARGECERRTYPGDNRDVFAWFDDQLDVMRWCLAQPRGLPVRLCSTCERRPARFDDLCGRCAERAGTRPKGKVS